VQPCLSDRSTPKYRQLHRILQDKIRSGECRIGDRLGTEAELTRKYNVSTTTVTRVLRDMEREGAVVRKRGKGTFVRALEPAMPVPAEGTRTLLLCGKAITVSPDACALSQAVNGFIGYEVQRGIINNFRGPVRLVYEAELLSQARQPGADQFCAVLVNPPGALVEALEAASLPHIRIDSSSGVARTEPNAVTLDRLRGIYEGMAYLIRDLRHRDIALITACEGMHPDRVFGYASALRAFDIPYREALVAHDLQGGTREAGRRAMARLLQSGARFTAVFVDTDVKARGAIQALEESGRRVPQDTSVLGFDDVPEDEELSPALTTVRVPHYEMGAEAIRLLNERLARDGAAVSGTLLSTRLVVRASCGPRESREAPETR